MNAVVNPDEARKAVVNSLSNPSEDVARHVLALAGANPNQIEKSITTDTGLVAYDLQAPAKNLRAVIDQKEAAARAALSLPAPTSSSAPTVAGLTVSAIEAAAQMVAHP